MADDTRTRIYATLAAAAGWVSGESLAASLGISRAAVGKHVAQLRLDGHYIASSTRKGFWLRMPAERIDPAAVAAGLRTHWLGRGNWVCLDDTTSTNSEAVALALDGAAPGTVVTAETQRQGKGRKGHTWFSSPRGLQFSLILPPENEVDAQAVTALAQTALIQAVAALEPGVCLERKFPNDLLLGGRKCAGILVESGWRGEELDWLVLGVGCNINVLLEEFPREIIDRVTSIFAYSGRAMSKNRILAEYLSIFEHNWPKLM